MTPEKQEDKKISPGKLLELLNSDIIKLWYYCIYQISVLEFCSWILFFYFFISLLSFLHLQYALFIVIWVLIRKKKLFSSSYNLKHVKKKLLHFFFYSLLSLFHISVLCDFVIRQLKKKTTSSWKKKKEIISHTFSIQLHKNKVYLNPLLLLSCNTHNIDNYSFFGWIFWDK